MKIAQTLEKVRHEKGIKTDGELARYIGIDKRRISDYLKENREPTSADYAKIALAAGISAGELWEAVQLERADNEESKSTWTAYMKKLGGLAASFMGVVFVLQSEVEKLIQLALLSP